MEKWFVNGAEVTEGQDFSLSADKCELTILKAKTDYAVEVELTKNAVTLTAKFTGEKTGYSHSYTFKVRDIADNTNLLNTSTTDGKFTCSGIQASNKVKIEATFPVGRKAKYRIKEWQKIKDDGSTWETIQDSQNKRSIELIMNKNEEVKAVLAPQYTVTSFLDWTLMIVVMNKRNDGNVSANLPDSVFSGNGNMKYGKTKVIAYNGASQKIAECTVNNNQDHIQKFKRKVNLAFSEDFFLISDMSSNLPVGNETQAKYIELQFEKPEASSIDKKIIWKYNLANYLPYTSNLDTAQNSNMGKSEYGSDGKTSVKFEEVQFLKDSSILYLWLHEVE